MIRWGQSNHLQEAMRSAVVMDSDGSLVFNKVKLTPSNWCVLSLRFVTVLGSLRPVQGLACSEKGEAGRSWRSNEICWAANVRNPAVAKKECDDASHDQGTACIVLFIRNLRSG